MQNTRDSLQSQVLWSVAMLQAMVQHCVELPVDALELESFARVIQRFTSYGAISCEDFLQESLLKILQDEKKFPTGKELFDYIRMVAKSRYLDNFRNESNRSRLLKTNWAQIKSLTHDSNREKTNAQVLSVNIDPDSEASKHTNAHILREYLLDLVCKSEKVCEAIKKHGEPDALTTVQLKRLTHTELGMLMAPQLLSYKSYEMTNKEIALKLYNSEKENDVRKISRAMKVAIEILDAVCIIDTDLSFTDYI
jgi:DNA-directed RNA polymerase specialized sigma24 family protein